MYSSRHVYIFEGTAVLVSNLSFAATHTRQQPLTRQMYVFKVLFVPTEAVWPSLEKKTYMTQTSAFVHPAGIAELKFDS